MDWRERLRRDSEACLADLAAGDPRFALDVEQPEYRGGTHYVTFGLYDGRSCVYKRFVAERRWRNESACLALLRDTGLVPEVFHEIEGTLIVMERLGGEDVLSPQALGALDAEGRLALSREVGGAFGRLVAASLPEPRGGYDPLRDFPDWGWRDGLPSVVERCLRLGRGLVDAAGPRSTETLRSSLALLEERLPAMLGEPWGLFHEDASNLRVEGTRFVGLYDLELCRGGTPSMQLGAALNLVGSGRLSWRGLVEGFERVTETRLADDDLRSALAANHLSLWIRLCGRLDPDGGHADEGALEEAEASAERMDAARRAFAE